MRRYSQNCVLQSLARKVKKEKITQLNTIFHPFPPPDPTGPICTIFGTYRSDRRRNHPSQFLSRLIQGFGATGVQILGFPIDFDSRLYNSVTHYRATL